jgi:hypothetical protein
MNTASSPDITPITVKSKRARPRKRTSSAPILAATEERAPSAPKTTARRLGVVDQVRLAFARGHRLATLIGFVFGGAPSSLAYYLVHEQIPDLTVYDWRLWATIAVVCGGLLFSLRTVYQWGVLALSSKPKAFGFCLIVEGAMIVALHAAVSLSALTILVLINGIATGTTLARGARAIEAKEEI